MAEYIDREKAIELLREPIVMSMCLSIDECHHKIAQRRIDLYLIENIPAADARPVVRGHNTRNARIFSCSECGYGIEDIFLSNEEDYSAHPNFCPNCGATMETRARWIPNVPPRDLRPRCSACGVLNPTEESTCPNCGAAMVKTSSLCDTCAHKDNAVYDYCKVCNSAADMYWPKEEA